MRPPPTIDSLFEGQKAAKEAWLETQRAAQEEAYRKAHPFKPTLTPQPASMAHVRGTLSISNPRFLEYHKRRQAERQALAHRQAKMREASFACFSAVAVFDIVQLVQSQRACTSQVSVNY
jgi:hypothetical protein